MYICNILSNLKFILLRKLFLYFHHRKRSATLLAITWTVLIVIACLIPGSGMPKVNIAMADKWVHFIIFAGFSFLWLQTRPKAGMTAGLFWFLLSVLLGYLVEVLQGSGITKGRAFDWYDVLADAIGGLLGVLLYFAMRSAWLKQETR